jgi:hypothetical protein
MPLATTEDTPLRSPASAAPPGVEPPLPGVSPGFSDLGELCKAPGDILAAASSALTVIQNDNNVDTTPSSSICQTTVMDTEMPAITGDAPLQNPSSAASPEVVLQTHGASLELTSPGESTHNISGTSPLIDILNREPSPSEDDGGPVPVLDMKVNMPEPSASLPASETCSDIPEVVTLVEPIRVMTEECVSTVSSAMHVHSFAPVTPQLQQPPSLRRSSRQQSRINLSNTNIVISPLSNKLKKGKVNCDRTDTDNFSAKRQIFQIKKSQNLVT